MLMCICVRAVPCTCGLCVCVCVCVCAMMGEKRSAVGMRRGRGSGALCGAPMSTANHAVTGGAR
jgi:hypothetical protein